MIQNQAPKEKHNHREVLGSQKSPLLRQHIAPLWDGTVDKSRVAPKKSAPVKVLILSLFRNMRNFLKYVNVQRTSLLKMVCVEFGDPKLHKRCNEILSVSQLPPLMGLPHGHSSTPQML